LHADTLVPPPGAWWRLHPDLAVNHAAGPRRSGTPTAAERGRLAAAAAAADKFDELDEEAMAPLSWRSPAPTTTTVHSLFQTSFCGEIPPPKKKELQFPPSARKLYALHLFSACMAAAAGDRNV